MPVLPLVASMRVLSGVQFAGALGFEDHVERGPVFDGPAGVEILRFCVDLDAGELRRDLLQTQQGRVADISDYIVRRARRDRELLIIFHQESSIWTFPILQLVIHARSLFRVRFAFFDPSRRDRGFHCQPAGARRHCGRIIQRSGASARMCRWLGLRTVRWPWRTRESTVSAC